MAAYWGVLLAFLSWVQFGAPQRAPVNSFYFQCNRTSVSLAVKIDPLGTGLQLDPSNLFLGQCHPSSTIALRGYFVFEYSLRDCGFSRLTYGNTVKYSADLVYTPSGSSYPKFSQPFREQINCNFTRSLSPTPSNLIVESQLSGAGSLLFSGQFMKGDFSGRSDLKVFTLGTPIFVELSVLPGLHLPSQIYVDQCTVAPTDSLSNAKETYSLIQNHGCFVDGKEATSTYLARPAPSSIRLTFQALSFKDLDTDLFLHFQVVVWDPKDVSDPSRKACSYLIDSARWILLDNPSDRSLCNCCDTICRPRSSRRRRQANSDDMEEVGLVHNMVLGPFRVDNSVNGSQVLDRNLSRTEAIKGLVIPPAVSALLMEVAVLLVMSVGVIIYSRTNKKNPKETDTKHLINERNH
ncbi:hypothetical protein XENTR_v10002179 [Xenopus tropicalis]|uniref:Zona pellucida glycoprotein 3 (sperm receptor), gene 2 n=2 Tax=Xenopus tropicalis TaxID=8364 RepID=F6VHA3_XENTR|nr:zona pellucida sperm-binding protein 3 [Xenopus tropicalis]KAE8634034.1 hypothetical protein XENTR_v10002179 [Xenopus tropicalis]|eukprot:XP_002934337.1 PREDICTED: zona pellucida sperm-binding protein 3 [Xenopus tropicalis]